ncbi:MAG: cation:proton antiporter [Planctomycetaceae bacterium]
MAGVAFVAIVLVAYALLSRRLGTTVVSGALFFAGAGLLAGSRGLGIVTPGPRSEETRLLFEATLAVVLFTDAAATTASALLRERVMPLRLLAVGLPLSILAGWGVALALPSQLSLWEAALVGAILAPTDAALGEAVISNPRVPALVRDGLSVESGLNDGLALPFVTIFVALALAANGQESSVHVVETFLRAIVLSAAIGVATAWVVTKLLRWSRERGWADPFLQPAALLATIALVYVAADAARGSGFIAVWAAGATAGTVGAARLADAHPFFEELIDLLSSVSFLLFGAAFLGPAIAGATWVSLAYAVLCLSAVRMAPVAIALLGTGMSRPTVAYVGWFGPRGLASIIFAGLVVENELPGATPIVHVVMLTVGLSIVLHGMTAWWGAERYADWYERAARARPDLPEAAASAPVVRRRATRAGRPQG